jgi:hypothetical protein
MKIVDHYMEINNKGIRREMVLKQQMKPNVRTLLSAPRTLDL